MTEFLSFDSSNAELIGAVSGVFGLALGLTVLAVILARKMALKWGIVDKPGGRKQHDVPVPPVGGLAIFSVLIICVTIVGSIYGISLPIALLLSLLITLVLGVIDDIREVDARLKFVIHFLVAGILVIGGHAQIIGLGDLLGFGPIWLGWMAIPFSMACVVYIINAVNMMDGLDGLAAGNTLIIFLWFGLAAFMGEQIKPLIEISIFSACLIGFLTLNARLPWNKHAKIFLGDAGSMGLGIMIAWYAITLSQNNHIPLPPVSVAWIIALPIIDAFGLLVARLKDKKPPFSPDRRHFHHHFINAGFGVGPAVYTIIGWSIILGSIGFLGAIAGLPQGLLGWAWVVLWLGHAALTIHHQKFIRLLSRATSSAK
ncbi:MAG TPA: MraY family glycosyltransferase [Alphaproteobacteria bacterium]|nr:undecaprenyl/decaprenyl-phosphate alpha-N-acetylglucosaminyl 1-phosphate transferase [Alphaproteobacteria bacterium]HOO50291.1 MraY family glycosyltransferase [Alphaproteobacteria bacterium]